MAAALQTHLHRGRLAGVDLHAQPAAGLRAAHCRIHRVLVAVDDAAMERLLRKRAARLRGRAEHARAVRLVVGEEEARAGRQLEAVRAEPRLVQQAGERRRVRVVGEQRAVVRRGDDRLRRVTAVPRPRVAEPELRDEVQRRALAAAVVRRHAHDERVLVRLGDLDLDVEVAVVVERAGVDQLVLRLGRAARAVALDQVDVEVTLLHVLAVVPLGRHEAEVALLENRIALVPERHRPAEDLVAIRESGDAVLAPAIGLEAREVVREKAPGVAVRAVVLAHGAPGAVREVRAPLAPPGERVRAAAEALPFRVHGIVDSLSTLIKTESPMRLVTRADLDGLTSGVIITMKEPIDEILLVHPQDITDKRVEIRGDDILANVPYHPNAGKWFDHHLLTDSNEKPPADFEGRYRVAPSAARLVYEYYLEKDPDDSALKRLAKLVDETDRLDAAQLTPDDVENPQGTILLGYTIDSRTGLGSFEEYFRQLVAWLRTLSIDEVLQQPEVKRRVDRIRNEQEEFRSLLQRNSFQLGNVVVTDLREIERLPAGNRFLVYSLFPDANVSLRVHWGPAHGSVIAAVGHSIFNRTCKTSVGELMSRYGGGGHRGAGTCVLPVEKAADAIDEILFELQANG